jgi:translation initiation factor eIF-2B subunit delta
MMSTTKSSSSTTTNNTIVGTTNDEKAIPLKCTSTTDKLLLTTSNPNNPTSTATSTITTTTTAKKEESTNVRKSKPVNPNIVIPPKKPPLSKAERRALQEKQRAEKAAAGTKPPQPKQQQQQQEGKGTSKDGIATTAIQQQQQQQQQQIMHSTTTATTASSTTTKTTEGTGTNITSADSQLLLLFDQSNVVQLFGHLPPYNNIVRSCSVSLEVQSGLVSSTNITTHPAILHLGIQYRDGIIRGANQRCRAMLKTFQTVIQQYNHNHSSSSKKHSSLSQELDILLKNSFTYLTKHSRPHSTSMGLVFYYYFLFFFESEIEFLYYCYYYYFFQFATSSWMDFFLSLSISLNFFLFGFCFHQYSNAFTFLKIAIANLDRDIPEEKAKATLCEQIDAYIRERITFADEAISTYAVTKIQNGDVILIYAKSEVILVILKKAFHQLKRNFRVIVVDSRPLNEGREMLSALHREGIPCTYILLNAVSYVMSKEVTKVFLGAAALMSDGSVQSRVGTYAVALMAQSCNVPVLVCCETYKISNRVQLESITGNELGNPDVGVAFTDINYSSTSPSSGGGLQLLRHWRTTPNLKLLNIMYDLTPSEFVSGIVTEMGILPPTSVAVILREMNPQDGNY